MTKLGLLLVLVVGCSGGNTSPSTTDQTSALCDLYRVACAREAECGAYLYTRANDAARCQEQLACEEVVAGMNAADIAISIPDATACRDALAAATCEGLVLWDDNGAANALVTTNASCRAVFAGQREGGDTCGWTQQCAEGLECAGETCPGTCAVHSQTRCTIGGCGDSAFCGTDGACKPRATNGGVCGTVGDLYQNVCADGLRCDFPPGQVEGTCKPQIARGASCISSGFFECENGDVCRDNLCAAPTPEGAPCGSFDECGFGSFCPFGEEQLCRPWRALGEACTFAGAECGAGASCSEASVCVADATNEPVSPPPTGTPRPFVGDGQDCEMANCSAGLACRPIDGRWRCETAPALGESCSPADPNDQFAVLLSGVTGVGGCREGICDVFASWTCVLPARPGDSCGEPGLTAACASAVCKLDGTCADYFEECPFN